MTIKSKKGSLTVEAAIALPIFICVIVSIIFFIKVVYTHQVIQHAITEAAQEMAAESYIYYKSGLREFGADVEDSIRGRADLLSQNSSTFFETFRFLFGKVDNGNSMDTVLDELQNTVEVISEATLQDMKSQLCIPIVKAHIKKHIPGNKNEVLDIRVKRLGIINGFDGLDFSRSGFFEQGSDRIDIVVVYKMNLPVPFKVYSKILMVQKASVNAWMGGDEGDGHLYEEDIWSLHNMQRGKRVREIFGANLPWFFPGISGFYSGKAVLIRSMDLTVDSYRSEEVVEEKVLEYIDNLSSYRGQLEPWGEEEIVIRESAIKSRELVLVIPKNVVEPEIKQVVFGCVEKAAEKGVVLRIEEYGYKKDEDSPNRPLPR